MKEKGFTLIELLVVIALIGLIMAFTIPMIMNSTDSSKENADAKTMMSIKDSARTYSQEYSENLYWFMESLEDGNEYTCIPLDSLLDAGYLKNVNVKEFDKFVKISRNRETFVINDEVFINNTQCASRDTIMPTLNVNVKYADNNEVYNQDWTNRNIVVNLSVSDNIGILKTEISSDNGSSWTTVSNTFSTTYSSNMNKKIKFRVTDKFQNPTIKDVTIKIDKTKPSCSIAFEGTLGSNNWYIGTTNGVIKPKDNFGEIQSWNITTSSSPSYSNNTRINNISDTTGRTYYGYVKDKAGNIKSCSNTIRKDTGSITIDMSGIPSSFYYNNYYSYNVPTSVTYGISGTGTVTCVNSNGSVITNLNQIYSTGTINLTCTATGVNGLTKTVTKSTYSSYYSTPSYDDDDDDDDDCNVCYGPAVG